MVTIMYIHLFSGKICNLTRSDTSMYIQISYIKYNIIFHSLLWHVYVYINYIDFTIKMIIYL